MLQNSANRNYLIATTNLLYQDLYLNVQIGNLILPARSHIVEDTIDELIENYFVKIDPSFGLKQIALLIRNSYHYGIVQVNNTLLENCKGALVGCNLPDKNRRFLLNRYSIMFLYYLFTRGSANLISYKNSDSKQMMDNFIRLIALANNKIEFFDDGLHSNINIELIEKKDSSNDLDMIDIYLQILRNYPSFDVCFSQEAIPKDFYMRWISRYEKVFCSGENNIDSIINEDLDLSHPGNSNCYKYLLMFVVFNFFTHERNDYPDFMYTEYFLEKGFSAIPLFLSELVKSKTPVESVTSLFDLERYVYELPFFIMRDGQIIIPDMHSLFNLMTIGTKYRVKPKIEDKKYYNAFGNKYGELMEVNYFHILMRKIFGEKYIEIGRNGQCDGILKIENSIIIFEFTTESFPREALWCREKLKKSINRVLFYPKKSKPKGKLFNLANYIKNESSKRQKHVNIIPILVTERYMGNFHLLDVVTNGYLTEEITASKSLLKANLLKHCIFLSLDDIEIFWGSLKENLEEEESVKIFLQKILEWDSHIREISKKSPEHLWLPFSRYILGNTTVSTNKEYQEFFTSKTMKKEDFTLRNSSEKEV